jgi:hypothetical protein
MEVAGFHNYWDANVRSNQGYAVATGWSDQFPPPITTTTRDLTYRFYPHFHPYVRQLTQRLIKGAPPKLLPGVASMEAVDTEYVRKNDGSLATLPDSTRATLPAPLKALQVSDNVPISLLAGAPLTISDGTEIRIPAGTAVTLLDGAPLTLSAAVDIKLPGSIPSSFPSGSELHPATGPAFILPEGAEIALRENARAALSDGTLVILPDGTKIELRSGVPQPNLWQAIFSQERFDPSNLVDKPWPVQDLDFTVSGAYSIYNWELFFHVPLLIAIHLSQNQKFQDAQNWFHFIFDPTDNSDGPTPQRFWKVKPFQNTDVELIGQILLNLSTGADPQLKSDTIKAINAWAANPFQPFVVAGYRPTSLMLKTVTAYLDNLIAWGDSLFAQYTIETINEATQFYVLAANILGPRPQVVPKKATVGPRTYADLRADLDAFGNALVEMEVDIPFDLAPHPIEPTKDGGAAMIVSIGQTPYFCMPRNDQLLAYWDTVADRLFKIHNSLNLQGVFQQLPLFDPPIDPALLVRAAAEGLDVSAIVAGLNQPLPLVRFRLLVAKAVEICQEAKSLAANWLAAVEKSDNEGLALTRAQHETIILNLGQMVKYSQWQEAIKAREALDVSLTNATQRYTYYQELLGRTDAEIIAKIPQMDPLDEGSLEKFNFLGVEPTVSPDPIKIDISQDAPVSDGAIISISSHESEELDKLESARNFQVTSSGLESLSSALSLIPQIKTHAQPMGVGVTVEFGGNEIAKVPSALAAVARIGSEEFSYEANKTAKMGSYSRRELEWTFQSNSIAGEINQIFKQLRGAQIGEAIASKEYSNYQIQMKHAQAIQDFLQNKPTNQGAYLWMVDEVRALYAKAYQLAFQVAKKAELALQSELGDPSLSYIDFDYVDGMPGLFSGEKLLSNIRRMETDYYDLHQREYELTTHVSLLQLDPKALIRLRATGSCTVQVPEELFDLDCPGHYFRRIKSVAVTIPCVTGSYTSINCRLTLLNSSIRTTSGLSGSDGYPRKASGEDRFNDYYGSIQAIVTSSGQADSGMFETNLNDERYLPFELSGAISQWQLDLPADVRQFDFDTITDVILHIRYTAREGGDLLKAGAVKNLQGLIDRGATIGSVRLFSVHHEFPSEWAKFRSAKIDPSAAAPTAALALTLLPQHYPFWAQTIISGSTPLKDVELVAEMSDAATAVNVYSKADGTGTPDVLAPDPTYGKMPYCAGKLKTIPLPMAITDPKTPFTLYFSDNSMSDLWLAVTWGAAS